MIAVVSPKELACCRCNYVRKYKGSNGWTCSLTNEIGYPCHADAYDRLENCPLIDALQKNTQKYCESPALGMDALKCSEDCCDYGRCRKQAYFDFIADKYNTTPDKIVIGTNFQFEKFVIEDREYSNEEVLEILKKHKAEEDKKYHKCERCGTKYLGNNLVNMVYCNLDKKPDHNCAWGYALPPYIRGFKILSTCGDGREVKLCDKCVKELVDWLGIK